MSTVASPTPKRQKCQELTPHEQRIARLLPDLIADFGDTHSPDGIRACAEDILARYDTMPGHHYVEVVAAREIREAVRSGRYA